MREGKEKSTINALPFGAESMRTKSTETVKERNFRKLREVCRIAKCPNADKDASECADCTGPVSWIDEKGDEQGRARACTSCKMNGKGLPVCWAACKGPSENFGTDGKKMMALGVLDNPETFIGQKIAKDYYTYKTPRGQVTRLTPEAEDAMMAMIRAFVGLTLSDLKALHALLQSKNPRQAALMLGITKQAMNQTQNRIADRDERFREFLFPHKQKG